MQHTRDKPVYEKRNEAIQIIKGLGGDLEARSIWGKLTGYSRRAVVESMMSRWKRTFSGSLKSRCLQRRNVEVAVKAGMINKVTSRKCG
ncbi:hypothetical protein [Rhabdochlamydiaceae symbiont of Dictyostelium giganteum]|uniref:hypothetical protein n=1 Tax=Rhabdochlamydiaceae symbiont of Dictyostelium giganteum TaxID=3342349 RepID=UPI003850B2DE